MFIAGGYSGRMVASPAWLKARLGTTREYPYTVFDSEGSHPGKIGLPEYRVNTSSLNLELEGTLFFMQCLGAPVNLRIAYASAPTHDGASTIGLFGKNWRIPYESVVGQFGPEAHLLTVGGRPCTYTTPDGQELGAGPYPMTLVPPAGVFDTLIFYGSYFEFTEKATRLVYRYGVAGGAGNALWRLTRITDQSGNQLNITVDAPTGQIHAITDAAGRSVTFGYDSSKNLCTKITAPDGRHIDFAYDTHKNLIKISDMAGNSATYAYNTNGFLTIMTTAGRSNKFFYAARPGYEVATSPQDDAGDMVLTAVTNPAGGVTRYTILPNDAGIKRTDPNGTVETFDSSMGQTTSVADPLGDIRSVTYSTAKLPKTFSDGDGRITAFAYDARGNLIRTTDALGKQTVYTYDSHDNRVTRTDALNNTTGYAYDANNRLVRVTTPMGFKTSFTYYGNGRLRTIQDAKSGTTTFLYNGPGDCNSIADPLTHQTTLAYDTAGRCTRITDPRGKIKTFQYDNNDRLVRVTYNSVSGTPSRTNVYDAFGQKAATDEIGHTLTLERNFFNFVTKVTDPLGNITTTTYDASNNPVAVTDALRRISRTTYDSANRPLVSTDPAGLTIKRSYDHNGNLLTITDKRGYASAFAYDANNRVLSIGDPLENKVVNTLDAVGRVAVVTNARGQQVRLTYDKDGRVVRKEYRVAPAGSFTAEAAFTYDANGNLLSQSDDWGLTTRVFDADNRVTSITFPNGKNVKFTCNESGLLADVRYPGGLVVTYSYNDFNSLSSPTAGRSGDLAGNAEHSANVSSLQIALGGTARTLTYTYNALGLPTRILRPNGVTTTIAYDGMSRLQSMVHASGTNTLLSWQYRFDSVSNLVSKAAAGNLALPEPMPEAATMTYDKANRIASRSGATYTHDADGNLTVISGGLFSAVYTPENRPQHIVRKAGAVTETLLYTYDAFGMRVKRVVQGGATTQYYYGPNGNLLFTTDAPGNVTSIYIWKGSTLAASLVGPSLLTDIRYPLLDGVGNVMAMIKPDGTTEAGYAYQPYGGVSSQPKPAIPGLFTYVGGFGVEDEGSGLFYMRNRFYDAVTGRFLQQDPSGFQGGLNLYTYASGSPAGRVDPYGLVDWGALKSKLLNLGTLGLYGYITDFQHEMDQKTARAERIKKEGLERSVENGDLQSDLDATAAATHKMGIEGEYVALKVITTSVPGQPSAFTPAGAVWGATKSYLGPAEPYGNPPVAAPAPGTTPIEQPDGNTASPSWTTSEPDWDKIKDPTASGTLDSPN